MGVTNQEIVDTLDELIDRYEHVDYQLESFANGDRRLLYGLRSIRHVLGCMQLNSIILKHKIEEDQ